MSIAPILEVQSVSRYFGKFQALHNITTSFQAGELTAIIGPNGAGKSTFFNVISGGIAPSSGKVHFEGRDISPLAQHDYARVGIAKSFQITNVFKHLSAHENVRVALQMQTSRYQILKARVTYTGLSERADALLERV